jgi:hypothetical protein
MFQKRKGARLPGRPNTAIDWKIRPALEVIAAPVFRLDSVSEVKHRVWGRQKG